MYNKLVGKVVCYKRRGNGCSGCLWITIEPGEEKKMVVKKLEEVLKGI